MTNDCDWRGSARVRWCCSLPRPPSPISGRALALARSPLCWPCWARSCSRSSRVIYYPIKRMIKKRRNEAGIRPAGSHSDDRGAGAACCRRNLASEILLRLPLMDQVSAHRRHRTPLRRHGAQQAHFRPLEGDSPSGLFAANGAPLGLLLPAAVPGGVARGARRRDRAGRDGALVRVADAALCASRYSAFARFSTFSCEQGSRVADYSRSTNCCTIGARVQTRAEVLHDMERGAFLKSAP